MTDARDRLAGLLEPPADLVERLKDAYEDWLHDEDKNPPHDRFGFFAAFAAEYAAEIHRRDIISIINLKCSWRLCRERAEAAEQALAEEREACAKAAEGYEPQHEANETIARQVAKNIAAAIRARKGDSPSLYNK